MEAHQKLKLNLLADMSIMSLLKIITWTHKAAVEISVLKTPSILLHSTPRALSREELTKAENNAMTCMVRKPLIIKDAQQDIVNQWGSKGKHLQLNFIDALCLFFPKTTRQFYCTQNFKLGFTSNNILLVISASGNVGLLVLFLFFPTSAQDVFPANNLQSFTSFAFSND